MFAHIVNPFFAPPDSSQAYEQGVTFETMRRARVAKTTDGDVALLSAQFAEDHPIIPDDFIRTPDLVRSMRDVDPDTFERKLPFIGDIWRAALDNSDAEFVIYTNADIALMPSFYDWITEFASAGNRAFSITRRDIVDYQTKNGLTDYYTCLGESHGGWDCFVIARDIAEKMPLGDICIGAQFIGAAMVVSASAFADELVVIDDRHLTFHLGQDKSVPNDKVVPYRLHNALELAGIIAQLHESGDFKPTPTVMKIAQTVNSVIDKLSGPES